MIEANPKSESSQVPDVAEEVEDFQRSISDGFNQVGDQKTGGKNKKLYCFSCHRMEYHYNALKGKAYHHLLVGLTFGIAWLFGPFRCRCCGHRRMCRFNFLNPRFHVHKWKYSGKGVSASSSSRVQQSSAKTSEKPDDKSEVVVVDETHEITHKKRRRRKRKLKSVPTVSTIGKERKERAKLEEYTQTNHDTGMDFSIDGIVGSFETEQSRKERLQRIAMERSSRGPFKAKKAKPRRRVHGKPKRRHAKKEKLSGPTVYCFSCKQKNEHYHILKGTTYYSFLFGVTFGTSAIVGPFRCSVCSKKRLLGSDVINPKYAIRSLLANSSSGYG